MNRTTDTCSGCPRERSTAAGESGGGGDPVPSPGRRRFLTRLAVALASLAALAAAAPVVGFVLQPVLRRAVEAWRKVGRVGDFTVGDTVLVVFADAGVRPWAGPTGRTGAWLRRVTGEDFIAFAVDCTHLGCPVRWEAGAELFMCPCHGGVYYKDGTVAGGPPPLPLRRYQVRVREGNVEIRTTPLPIT